MLVRFSGIKIPRKGQYSNPAGQIKLSFAKECQLSENPEIKAISSVFVNANQGFPPLS